MPRPGRNPIPALDTSSSPRARVLDVSVDRVDMDQAVAICTRFVELGETAQHMAVNAAKIVSLRNDPRLRAIVERCELVTADGQSIVWASRLLGDPLPERVPGIDLMFRLLEVAERRGYGVYILGARPQVLETALRRIRSDYPGLRVAGSRDGYFSPEQESQVAEEIRESDAQILFVAISSPRKEEFLGAHRETMNVPLVMGVGGSIDVVAGLTRRAPAWMQRSGLEWLFRLVQEPRRLLGRYAVTNVRFLWLLGREWLSNRAAARRP